MKTRFLTLVLWVAVTAIMMNSCAFLKGTGSTTTDSGALCLDYKNSDKSQLDTDLVSEMTMLYQQNPILNEDNVKAIRFDLETLKKFIYHIEMEAKRQSKPSKDLGIRIYYARYPKMDEWRPKMRFENDLFGFLGNPITEQYELKHTLIMIPTIYEEGIHKDYNPLSTTSNLNNNIDSVNNYSKFKKKQTFGLMPKETDNLKQNHGELYPPYPTNGMDFIH